MSFFESAIKKEDAPFKVVCGKWGIEYFRERGQKSDRQFVFKDVPSYAEGVSLATYLTELYSSDQADEIIFMYQKFKNILTQVPASSKYLPAETEGSGSRAGIYYPDKESVEKELYGLCLKNRAYSFLLEWASGVQAATMMAMRTASDNAVELKAKLDLQLNRKRQSQVTSGVIEISSSNES
jgi:F-type H+-transporting ATPase subunit gamma